MRRERLISPPTKSRTPRPRVVARVNPLSYLVDLMRGLMVQGGSATFGSIEDAFVLVVVLVVLLAIASRLYPSMAR